MSLELADHRLGDAGRDGEAKPDRAAGRREDGGVDANHLAVHVEQRATRVAAVDRGVGLDVVVERARLDVAAARRHDAGRHGAAQAERIADRHDRLADLHLARVSELDGGQRLVALDLEHGEIGLLVTAQQLGRQLAAVVQGHGDRVGLTGDVVVGHDDAGRIDDEAGADRLRLGLRPLLAATLLSEALGELAHELLELLLARLVRHLSLVVVRSARLHGDGDVHDRRRHLGGEVGEVVRRRLAGHCGGRSQHRRDQRRSRERGGQRQGSEYPGFGLGHFELSLLVARRWNMGGGPWRPHGRKIECLYSWSRENPFG
jgi:hypothetical protein